MTGQERRANGESEASQARADGHIVEPVTPSWRVDLRLFLNEAATVSWAGVDSVARAIGIEHWALAGGQMVMVHMATHGFVAHRFSADADLTVDVRAGRVEAMSAVAKALVAAGFIAEQSPGGVTKFINGAGRVDLLAPEGVNKAVPTIDGGRAIEAAGATQAFRRTELVEVQWADQRTTVLRCPTLYGALVAKAAAATGTNEGPLRGQRHLDDLVALASIMATTGPGANDRPTKKDRQRVAAAIKVLGPDNAAWHSTDSPADAAAVLDLLAEHPAQ